MDASGGNAGSGSAGRGGPLVVSGGGSTMVATDELLAEAAELRLLQRDAVDWRDRLTRIRMLDDTPAPAWEPGDVDLAVFRAEQAAVRVEDRSGRLADSLREAAENYGNAERTLGLLLRCTSALTAYTVGRFAPLVALLALPAASSALLISTVLGWLVPGWRLGARESDGHDPGPGPGGESAGDAEDWLSEHREILSDPLFVQAVRVLASSVDDAAAGAAGVPFPVSFSAGDEGLGLLGVPTSALGLLALGHPIGMLRETRVMVRRTAVDRAPPPRGLADLARRIPRAAPGAPQVRIERYGTARPVWVVYAGGTIDWSATAAGEPWDLTSNVASVADRQSGSYRTVVQAMTKAGIRPGDRVVQVGHSQGGLVAAQVAASAGFTTVAVATFGAPAGQVAVPPELPMIATEHSDDLVPALGGTPRDVTGEDNRHLVVRREAFTTGELPEGEYLPAHNMDAYEETARLEDASAEPRIASFRANLVALVGNDPGEVTLWRGVRTDETDATGQALSAAG